MAQLGDKGLVTACLLSPTVPFSLPLFPFVIHCVLTSSSPTLLSSLSLLKNSSLSTSVSLLIYMSLPYISVPCCFHLSLCPLSPCLSLNLSLSFCSFLCFLVHFYPVSLSLQSISAVSFLCFHCSLWQIQWGPRASLSLLFPPSSTNLLHGGSGLTNPSFFFALSLTYRCLLLPPLALSVSLFLSVH